MVSISRATVQRLRNLGEYGPGVMEQFIKGVKISSPRKRVSKTGPTNTIEEIKVEANFASR